MHLVNKCYTLLLEVASCKHAHLIPILYSGCSTVQQHPHCTELTAPCCFHHRRTTRDLHRVQQCQWNTYSDSWKGRKQHVMAIGYVKINQYTLYLCWWLAASCNCSWSSSDLAWYSRLTCIHGEGERTRVTFLCGRASTDVSNQSQLRSTNTLQHRQSPVQWQKPSHTCVYIHS